MNILILALDHVNGDSEVSDRPLCLAEVGGAPVLNRLLATCNGRSDVKHILALREQDIQRYALDKTVLKLAPSANIIRIGKDPCGPACTALLAAAHIDNNEELLVLNGHEFIDVDVPKVLNDFKKRKLDAGTISFPSVHPGYAYVRLNHDDFVVEAAEKNPISRHAMVGFYWFAKGKDFVNAVKNMIRKDSVVNDQFYISLALNELILEHKQIGIFGVDAQQYHSLETEH